MAIAVYVLCTLTSMACAVLLSRAYRESRARLLLFSALCFFGLAFNNLLLVADVTLHIDLSIARKVPALIGVVLLLHGLIGDTR